MTIRVMRAKIRPLGKFHVWGVASGLIGRRNDFGLGRTSVLLVIHEGGRLKVDLAQSHGTSFDQDVGISVVVTPAATH